MSLATEKLKVTKVVDSRGAFPEWEMPVREGGNVVSYLQSQATSLGNVVSFSIVPPNPSGSVLSRDILVYNKLTFTLAGADQGIKLVNIGTNDAPRAFPWSSCIDTMALQLNNETITVGNWAEIGHVMRRFNPRSSLYKLSNFCPWFPDQSANYKDLIGTNRNPLAAGAVGDYDYLRGAYFRCFTTANTNTDATVVLETYEPLNLSPFMFGSKAPGIPYTQTLGLTFNMGGYTRALSRAVGAALAGGRNLANFTSVSVEHNASRLFYQTVAVPLLEGAIPRSISLPHYKLVVNTSQATSITSAVPSFGTPPAGSVMSSPVITYPSIPSRIYVFAQPVHSSKTAATPDYTAMYCGGLNVLWNARTALMTSTQREQLYAQAVEAGFAGPWEAWSGVYRQTSNDATGAVGSSGSVLCLRPGVDFDLEAGQVVGQAGTYQFQVQANFQDQAGNGAGGNTSATLYVVAVLNGVLTINSGYECHQVIGPISQADVLEAQKKVSSEGIYDTYGSGFFDNLKELARKAVPYIQQGAKFAHAGLSAAKDAGLLGSAAHSGGDLPSMYGGSALSGGARLTKKDLSARLR